MGQLTASRPKPLLKLGDETLIERILRDVSAVAEHVCVVVAPDDELIRRTLGRERHGTLIRYVEQPEPRGVGDAICRCSGVVTGPFAVIMGDAFFETPLAPRLSVWRDSREPGAVLVQRIETPLHDPAGLVRVEDGRIRDLAKGSDPAGFTHRVCGVFMFPPEVFDVCGEMGPPGRGELEAEDLVTALLKRGMAFTPVRYDGWRRNVNRPDELEEVRRRASASDH